MSWKNILKIEGWDEPLKPIQPWNPANRQELMEELEDEFETWHGMSGDFIDMLEDMKKSPEWNKVPGWNPAVDTMISSMQQSQDKSRKAYDALMDAFPPEESDHMDTKNWHKQPGIAYSREELWDAAGRDFPLVPSKKDKKE